MPKEPLHGGTVQRDDDPRSRAPAWECSLRRSSVAIQDTWPSNGGALALLLAGLLLAYWVRIYHHPLLQRLSGQPEALPDLELESLVEARRLLRKTRRLDATLAAASISCGTLEQATALADGLEPVAFCKTLARRLKGVCEPVPHNDLALFTPTLPEGFLLNLQHCLLVAPDPRQTPAELSAQLSGLQMASAPVGLLIGRNLEQGAFTRGELMDRLEALDFSFQPQQLEQSLLRMELAFILGEENGGFRYRVPLFREMILGQEPKRALVQLVRGR